MQPTADLCGYMIIISESVRADWVMGACNTTFIPGAFLCRTSKHTNLPQSIGPIRIYNNSIHIHYSCENGWIPYNDKCIYIYKFPRHPASNSVSDIKCTLDETKYVTYNWFHSKGHRAFKVIVKWLGKLFSNGNGTDHKTSCSRIFVLSNVDVNDSATRLIYDNGLPDGLECAICAKEQTLMSDPECPDGLLQCEDGTCISSTAMCDGKQDCLHGRDEQLCKSVMCHINGMFQAEYFCRTNCSLFSNQCMCGAMFWQCKSGGCVSVSKLCDYQEDCQDGSDESCQFQTCSKNQIQCKNKQCVSHTRLFDFQQNCLDDSDENAYGYSFVNSVTMCSTFDQSLLHLPQSRYDDFIPDCSHDEDIYSFILQNRPFNKSRCLDGYIPCLQFHPRCYPAEKLCVFDVDNAGEMLYCRIGQHLKECEDFPCNRHYKCPGAYCIPVRLLCDGRWHCPNGEDELHCSSSTIVRVCTKADVKKINVTLPPFIRTNIANGTCVSVKITGEQNHVSCPGMFRCQLGQCLHLDELCDGIVHCPLFADDEINCFDMICPRSCLCLGKTVFCTNTIYTQIPQMSKDVHAIIFTSNKGIISMINMNQYTFLVHLDLSWNMIGSSLHNMFLMLGNIRYLDIAGNNFTFLNNLNGLHSLIFFNVSFNSIVHLESDLFAQSPALKYLDLSHNQIKLLDTNMFGTIDLLYLFDISNNTIEYFDSKFFKHFNEIKTIVAGAYRYCCIAKKVFSCGSSGDVFSSCDSLLAYPTMKVSVYIVSLMGALGNGFVIFDKIKSKNWKFHSVLILNLAVSDSLYSTYLIAIAIADAYFSGSYIIYDDNWRNGLVCKILSFSSLFAMELSILILLCISIERYLNIHYAIYMRSTEFKFNKVLLSMAWMVALATCSLSFVLDWYFDESSTVKNSICIMLEINLASSYQALYLIGVYVIMNGICFFIILLLYSCIVIDHVRSTRQVGGKINYTVFRQSLLIVITNFLCWAPAATYMLVAFNGKSISPKITVWLAIVILPLNSALNPLIYTSTHTVIAGILKKIKPCSKA